MKILQLKYFLKIAELGSISAASRQLFIAQPALTHHISALENDLEVKLFARSVKGVQLTPAGEKLVHHANLILRQIENARTDLISDEMSPRGEIRLVIDSSKAYNLIPMLVTETAKRFPDIQLTVYEAMSPVAAQHIAEGKVDLALIPNAADLNDVLALPVYRESMYLVGKHIFNEKNARHEETSTISFKELSKYPLVCPSRLHNIRKHIEQSALEANRPLNIRYEQNTAQELRSFINSGIACAIIPRDVMAMELQQGELQALKIVQPSIERIHSLVRLNSRKATSALSVMESLIIELISHLCDEGVFDGQCLANKSN